MCNICTAFQMASSFHRRSCFIDSNNAMMRKNSMYKNKTLLFAYVKSIVLFFALASYQLSNAQISITSSDVLYVEKNAIIYSSGQNIIINEQNLAEISDDKTSDIVANCKTIPLKKTRNTNKLAKNDSQISQKKAKNITLSTPCFIPAPASNSQIYGSNKFQNVGITNAQNSSKAEANIKHATLLAEGYMYFSASYTSYTYFYKNTLYHSSLSVRPPPFS